MHLLEIITAWVAITAILTLWTHRWELAVHDAMVPTTDPDRMDRVLGADGGPVKPHNCGTAA